MAKVTMPQLGESVAEGTIGRWLKQPGDTVVQYEPLLEVITDKVNAEVPSPFAGVLKEILVQEGETVPNNAEIAVIETQGEAGADAPPPVALEKDPDGEPDGVPEVEIRTGSADGSAQSSSAAAAAPSAPTSSQPAFGPAGSDERTPAETERAAATLATRAPASSGNGTSGPAGQAGDPNARMTPAVRRLLREHGLSPDRIVGTGGGGRITREDVLNVVEAQRTGTAVAGQQPAPAAPADRQPSTTAAAPAAAAPAAPPVQPGVGQAPIAPPQAPPPAGTPGRRAALPAGQPISFPDGADEVLVPTTQMRKGIAAQMTRALQAPHAYVQMEVDVTRLVALRDRAKRDYQAKEGLSLSFVPFVVKACAEALKRNPTFNAHWTDEGLVAKRRINIGVAVAVEDGLIVPVIRDADQLSIHGLNRAISDVAGRARANRLRIDDFGGGTFTVDNTGYLGTNLVMPILNVPEVGIVTMEAITKRPVVVETPDGDVIAIRPVMNMVLGVDHRANDGAGGAALLRDIKAWLESVGPHTPIW